MNDASIRKLLIDFGSRVGKLFGSRPYWLVDESLVRSELIAALLARENLFPGPHDINARHICTEATVGQVAKLDLVARPLKMPLIAVELKGWNIVTKFQEGSDRVVSSNASRIKVAQQIDAIGKDIRKLALVSKGQPDADCLLVIYAQDALDGKGARRFAGRKLEEPLTHTIYETVASATALRSHLKQYFDEQALKVDIKDVWSSKSVITCAAGTHFRLMAFRITALGRARRSPAPR